MNIHSFPFCCTTDIIYGLGGTANQDYRAQTVNDRSMATMVTKLEYFMSNQKRRAMLTAVCTDQQTDFLKVARAFGWREGPWASSENHRDTRTKLLYWLVQDGIPPIATVRNKLGLTT